MMPKIFYTYVSSSMESQINIEVHGIYLALELMSIILIDTTVESHHEMCQRGIMSG